MALLCQFYSLQRVHPALAVAETLLTEEHQKNSKSIHAENGSSSEIHPRGAANKASGAAAEAAWEGIPQSRRWSEPEWARGGGTERAEGGSARSLRAGGLGVDGVPHRPGQGERECAHCRGKDRVARELSTAASAERIRLYCWSDCGWACAELQWDLGRLKFSLSLFPALQLHPQRWFYPEKLNSTLWLIQYPYQYSD